MGWNFIFLLLALICQEKNFFEVCLNIRHIMKPSLSLCLYILLYSCRIQFYDGMKCVL
jgi:hypothetical protein